MNINFIITGGDDAKYHVKLLDEKIRLELKRVMSSEVILVATRAKQIITENRHIITGTLKRSIQGSAEWVTFDKIKGVIATDVLYAPYVEALPDGGYLYPALKQKQKEVVASIRSRMKAILDGVR